MERRVFRPIPRRHIPSRRIIPGFAPTRCPVCDSTDIRHRFIPSPKWVEKQLVRAGMEVRVSHPLGETEIPTYYCSECGFVISRAFRERETISFIPPVKEAYVVEDTGGDLHYLVSVDADDPVRPFYGAVEIVEARQVVPVLPMSAAIVRVGVNLLYKTVRGLGGWCMFHETREVVNAKIERVREYTADEVNGFAGLIRRRGTGYSVRDGVLAYLVSCLRGTKSFVAGFLRASDFTGYKDVGVSTVGEALSRIQSLGITPPEFTGLWRVAYEKTNGYRASYVPVNYVFREKEYIIRVEAAQRIKEKTDWWRVMDLQAREVPQELGLAKWF